MKFYRVEGRIELSGGKVWGDAMMEGITGVIDDFDLCEPERKGEVIYFCGEMSLCNDDSLEYWHKALTRKIHGIVGECVVFTEWWDMGSPDEEFCSESIS